MRFAWGEGGVEVVTSVSGGPGEVGSAPPLTGHILCTSLTPQTEAGVQAELQAG